MNLTSALLLLGILVNWAALAATMLLSIRIGAAHPKDRRLPRFPLLGFCWPPAFFGWLKAVREQALGSPAHAGELRLARLTERLYLGSFILVAAGLIGRLVR